MMCNLPVANGQVDGRYTKPRRHQNYDVICEDARGNWHEIQFRDQNTTLYDYMVARGFVYDSAIIEEV